MDTPETPKLHTLYCAEAKARTERGETIVLTTGPCWCGSEYQLPAVRKRAARRSVTPKGWDVV